MVSCGKTSQPVWVCLKCTDCTGTGDTDGRSDSAEREAERKSDSRGRPIRYHGKRRQT